MRKSGLKTRGDNVVMASQKPGSFAPVAGTATGTSGWRTSVQSHRSPTNKVGAKSGKRLILSDKPRMARTGDITDGYKPGWMGLSHDGGYGVTTKSRGINKRAEKAAARELDAEMKRLRAGTSAPVAEVAPEIPARWIAPVSLADVRADYEKAIANARQRESVGDASGAAAWMHEARKHRRTLRNK